MFHRCHTPVVAVGVVLDSILSSLASALPLSLSLSLSSSSVLVLIVVVAVVAVAMAMAVEAIPAVVLSATICCYFHTYFWYKFVNIIYNGDDDDDDNDDEPRLHTAEFIEDIHDR